MRHRARYRTFAAAAALALIAACATNPATGRRQIMLVGEAQEIAMGQEADQEVGSSLGLYPDDALQTYVAGLGKGLVAGMIVRPELARFGDLAQAGMQLMFLKFGRNDEQQADDLGLRYMTRQDYDPREMVEVFSVLD